MQVVRKAAREDLREVVSEAGEAASEAVIVAAWEARKR